MRPLALAEAEVPSTGRVSPVDGTGWLVTHPADGSVTLFEPRLRNPIRVNLPVTAFRASVSDRHLAAVTLGELVVCDRQGRRLWRRELAVASGGLPSETNCHLDAHGVLWVYLPSDEESDELVAHDAATGEVIARERLTSSVGAAGFWPHPDGRRLGLHVAMGQDTPLSHLAWLSDGRIAGHALAGEFLNGFTSAGDRYLSLPHDVREIAIRDVTTGAVIVACYAEEEPGHRLMEAAALVSDDFVLVGLNHVDSDFEEHRLLAARSLRRQADIDYGPLVMPQNSIAATDGRGRWVTNARDGVLRLWQLPERLTDEVDGQQTLW
ncbi:hypothetical protein ACQP2X_40255 [Actinoplanes sp. CA-131856]